MPAFLAFKVLLFTVLVPGTVILYIPYSLISDTSGAIPKADLSLAVPASVCILIGLGIYLRCAWEFAVEGLGTPAPIDPPKKLVITGLYRRTRNPMYQGILLLLLAECLLFRSQSLMIYAGSIGLTIHSLVVFYEEPILRARFGETYQRYCDNVPRWGFAFRAFAKG